MHRVAVMLARSVREYAAWTRRPESFSARISGFKIETLYEPFSEVGGDFYFAAPHGSRRMRVVIGDACGKGAIGSSLVTLIGASVRAQCRSASTPTECLSRLNDAAAERFPANLFVTAACLDFDERKRTIEIANAGHVPAVVRRRDGTVRIFGRASGPPLGVLPSPSYATQTTSIHPGDVVLLMTDGVSEALETDLVKMQTVCRLLADARYTRPSYLTRVITERLREFKRGPFEDDTTFMTVALDTPKHFPLAE